MFLSSVRHLWLLCLLWCAPLWAESLSARIDRDQISLEDTLSLQITYEGRSNATPDTSGLENNFDILQRSHSTAYSITNGRANSSVQWNFVLAPKIAGQLLIPPFDIEGTQSKPLSVTVTDQSQTAAAGPQKDIFIETSSDKNTAYVQEQIKVSYRLFYAVPLSNLEPKLFSLSDVRTTELPRREYTQQVGHRTYDVIEFTVVASADKSGTITLPSLRWTAYAEDSANALLGFRTGRSSIHRLNTDEIKLTIKPRPTGFPSNATWLPASQVNLTQEWSQPPDQFKVGEPITRTLTLTAQGASAEQLPSLVPTTGLTDFKFYPDKPSLDTQTSNQGLTATRAESVAIVPNKAGVLTLPAVKISWWDTASDSLKTAELPEQIIKVAEGAATADTSALPTLPNADTSTEPSSPPLAGSTKAPPTAWIILSGLLFISNLVFATLWWQGRGQQATEQGQAPKVVVLTPAEHFSQLLEACKRNDAKQTRDHLVAWAASASGKRFTRLAQVADWLGDQHLSEHLRQLDKSLFGAQANDWQGKLLAEHLNHWQQEHKKSALKDEPDLQSLY